MGDLSLLETIHELYISITAFLFDVVLCVVVAMQGGAEKGARRFFNVTLMVTASCFLSITSFFLTHARVGVPIAVALFVSLSAYMGNILVTYYLSEYIAGFFGPDAVRREVRTFNRALLAVSAAILIVYYITQIPNFSVPGANVFARGWFRALVGYVIDLYYMIFCVSFVRRGRELNRRAQLTIIAAFVFSVGMFAVQALLGSRPLVNYLGVSLGLIIFYFAAETPDYRRLQNAMELLENEKQRAEEAKALADTANRSKSDFLANMSHEIRTPINAVLGMNEMILRESTNENIITYAHNVESAGRNLLAIINDILDFSKIEANRMEINEAPYSLSAVLNDVCNMVTFRAQSKKLSFTADVDSELPDKLLGDEVRVRQIITNLLNNAVKYTDKGGVTLTVRGEGTGDNFRLITAVKDTGIGIQEEDMDKLFSKFERVDLEHNKTIEGTGLGLAITGNLLQLMNGKIDVKSTYGKGSVFTATIPQEALSDEVIGDFRERLKNTVEESDTYHETFRAPGAHILVVDDTEMNLTVIEGLLKKTLVLTELATSGEQALKLANDTPYDLILMDMRMPGMDGAETLRRIREKKDGYNARTPVICLTADAVQGAKERYLKEGFTDYLSKPVEGAALEAALMRYLPKHKVFRVTAEQLREAERAEREASETAERAEVKEEPAASPDAVKRLYAGRPDLDHDEALTYLATEELIEKTLVQFYENSTGGAKEIDAFFRDEDWENFTIRVHALKSSARLIGAMSLSKKAEELEALGNTASGL